MRAVERPRRSTHRHELHALSSLARYLPVFVGILLAIPFSLSVTRDGADIARRAWEVGADLLGMYGGAFAVALPFVLLVTSYLRRGRRKEIEGASLKDGHLVIAVGQGRERRVHLSRVRHGFAQPGPGELTTLSLELRHGLTEGDRIVLELEKEQAEPIARAIIGDAPRFHLSRASRGLGLAMLAVAAIVGSRVAAHVVTDVLRAARAFSPTPAQIEAWLLGWVVAATGAAHGVLSVLLSSTEVVAGVDGLRIESTFRQLFIGYDRILRVEARPWCLVVRLRGGVTRIVLAPGADRRTLEALADLANERRGVSTTPAAIVPEWQPGTVKRWREAIVRRVEGGGYREASVSLRELGEALEKPGVSKEVRVAAALALTSTGGAPERVRVRAAAATLADDQTRVALERIANDEADLSIVEAVLSEGRSRVR